MTKIVGVDLGSTLTKFAYLENDGQYADSIRTTFVNTADTPLESIVRKLTLAGHTNAFVTGINALTEKLLRPLIIQRLSGDPIQNEILIQARGVREILSMVWSHVELDDFLLVSVGTGTSYSIVNKDCAKKFPYGNAIGGGFVRGLLALNDMAPEMANIPPGSTSLDRSLDIRVKDLNPAATGFVGELTVAHFGNARHGNTQLPIVDACLNCVASAIVKDILYLDMIDTFKPPKHVVFIGSIVSRSAILRQKITGLFQQLSENIPSWNHVAIIPSFAQYAGALGALLCGIDEDHKEENNG